MRFCGSCGARLEAPLAPVRERRQVSVLFCDLVGFTTFSESRDHEDVRDVLDEYFASARRIVAGYGGMIEKFIGDAVMALWGAPVAHEDDAERAVRAGLELIEAVAELGQRLTIPELRVRVGVLTGEAAVEVGAEQEGMVTGDAVNTAARIQSIAPPGTLLADDTTRLACELSVEFEPGGVHTVKGKSEPVRVWRAVRGRDHRDGAVVTRAVEPPFVGRVEQLATMSAALQAVRDVASGVRVVSIVGEAGLGKSRLGRELELGSARDSGPARWLRGRSHGFGQGTGLTGLAEVVRSGIGIGSGDSPERQRAAAERFILDRFAGAEERRRLIRAVNRLLDVDDRSELIEQGELFSAWRGLLERIAADKPVVLLFEELQLADQALFDFLAHLRDWSTGTPILIVALSRPDVRLGAITHSPDEIELPALSEAETDELVTGAVTGAPETLLAAIRADGGGIPLYAVETLRALADRGVLEVEDGRYVVRGAVGDISIPPTVRALIASRLDALAPLQRRLLCAAAVLGESFAADAVAAVTVVDPADARAELDALVPRALLAYRPDQPVREYAFLQGVVRRVALAGLSRRERKRAHLAAVEYLESEHGSDPDIESVLAGHLVAAVEANPLAEDAGLLRVRAGAMLKAAAERAAAVGALSEAVSLFDRAAEHISDERERAEILERAGAVAFRGGDAEVSSARYQDAQEIHAAAGRMRERQRVRAHELRARYHLGHAADLVPALRALDAELGDDRDAVKALTGNVLAFALYQSGEHDEALAIASRSAAIAAECGDQGELVGALGAQASALQELGRPLEAIALQRRAVPLAASEGPRRAAGVLGNLAISLCSLGRYTEAADRARDAIAAAERGSERLFERWARLVLGRTLCSLGEWDDARGEIESVKRDVPAYYIGMAVAPLAVIALARGEHDDARGLVTEHANRCGGDPDSADECDFRLLRAAILMIERGDTTAALATLIDRAEPADYAEWTGWLPPILDHLVSAPNDEPLIAACSALERWGAIAQAPPVLAQRRRLEAHLAARAGEQQRAADSFGEAERLAERCGLAFERAVIALERAERAGAPDAAGRDAARETFLRLRSVPWLARAKMG
jgi:class 3 adenylate cyclase/tetratricopeptide (TPR) repeat protein